MIFHWRYKLITTLLLSCASEDRTKLAPLWNITISRGGIWLWGWGCGLGLSRMLGFGGGQRGHLWPQRRVRWGFARKGAWSVECLWDLGCSVLMPEYAVQGLNVAGAFVRQLVGHWALRVCGKGSSSIADLLSFAFQVFIQHVAAESRQVLWWYFEGEKYKSFSLV